MFLEIDIKRGQHGASRWSNRQLCLLSVPKWTNNLLMLISSQLKTRQVWWGQRCKSSCDTPAGTKGVNLNRWEQLHETGWPHRWHHPRAIQGLQGICGDTEKVRLPWVTPGWCHPQPDPWLCFQVCSIRSAPHLNICSAGLGAHPLMCFMISSFWLTC